MLPELLFGLFSLRGDGKALGSPANQQGKPAFYLHRDLGLLAEVFPDERLLQRLTGEAAIGHVRYATAGNGSVDNIQPFLF